MPAPAHTHTNTLQLCLGMTLGLDTRKNETKQPLSTSEHVTIYMSHLRLFKTLNNSTE